MWQYTFKRLIQGIITVWFIATATFFAMHSVPGDPLANDKAVTAEIRANLEAKYGLNRPLTEQYLIYMGNILQGDFGISFTQQNRQVNDIIRETLARDLNGAEKVKPGVHDRIDGAEKLDWSTEIDPSKPLPDQA